MLMAPTLMLACNAAMASVLLDGGANVNATNAMGKTALDSVNKTAAKRDRGALRKILVSHGAKSGKSVRRN